MQEPKSFRVAKDVSKHMKTETWGPQSLNLGKAVIMNLCTSSCKFSLDYQVLPRKLGMENVDFHTKKPVGLLASLPQISHFARSKHLREHLSYDSSLLSLHPRSNFIELSHI